MRFLAICLSLLLLVCGPILYLGIGAAARAERRAALLLLEDEKRDVEASLEATGRAPGAAAIARLRKEVAERRAARDLLVAKLLAFRAVQAPDDAGLRSRSRDASIDPAVFEPLLQAMPPGALGDYRRHVILRVVDSLAVTSTGKVASNGPGDGVPGAPVAAMVSPIRVPELHVARESAQPDAAAGLDALRVEIKASGDATALARFVESLLERRDDQPVGDLARLDLDVASGSAATDAAPPLTLELVVDFLIGASP